MVSKKIVLITGASSGIGKSTSLKLIDNGYVVYGTARRVENMIEISKKGVKTLFMDVTNDKSMRECVDKIIEEQGQIDVLINNAGYGSFGSLEDVSIEEARNQFEVNVFGLARLTQLVLPYMRKQRSGKIINVSSVVGKLSLPFSGWYCATKHALEALSDSLRLEVKEFGIKIIVIEPGAIKTKFGDVAYEKLKQSSINTPYKNKVAKLLEMIKSTKGSPVEVVSNTIVKALKSKNPSARYPTGGNSGLFLGIKRLMPDRIMDYTLEKRMK